MNDEASPNYMRIAINIASQIVKGNYLVGEKLFGQSTLSTEYAVSPETVRRAMCLLSDMKIVESKKHSGTVVISVDNAARFLEEHREKECLHNKKQVIRELLNKQAAITKMIENLCGEILAENETMVQSNDEIQIYEVKVPAGSWITGKNLVTVRFWAETEATVVAIRRNEHLILSPGPTAELYGGDQVLFAGKPETVGRVEAFLRGEEKSN